VEYKKDEKTEESIERGNIVKTKSHYKWERTGLLDGIAGNENRNTVADLLEAKAKDIMNREVGSRNDGNYNGKLLREVLEKWELEHKPKSV